MAFGRPFFVRERRIYYMKKTVGFSEKGSENLRFYHFLTLSQKFHKISIDK